MFGGTRANTSLEVFSDLWKFNVSSNNWQLVNGSPSVNQSANFGLQGIPSPSNTPGNRFGAVSWRGNDGSFWMFGGRNSASTSGEYADLWKFVPDSSCSCNQLVAAFIATDNTICPGTCVDFINNSISATSYAWQFPGGNPSSSTDANPTGICYNTPGNYSVTLTATGPAGTDTLTLSNYILVYPQPPAQSILQSGDTLFAVQGAVTYQWYQDNNLIPGATEYFYVATSSGDYNVVATDANGCEVEAVIYNVIAEIKNHPAAGHVHWAMYPNPVEKTLTIQSIPASEAEINVYDVFGKVSRINIQKLNSKYEVDVSELTPGIYFLELTTIHNQTYRRFIKQ
jgi:PKD repeat protein